MSEDAPQLPDVYEQPVIPGFEVPVAEIAHNLISQPTETPINLPEAQQIPSLHENLSRWQSMLEKLEAELPNIQGTNEWPEWYRNEPAVSRGVIDEQIKTQKAYGSVGQYYTLLDKQVKINSAISGREPYGNTFDQTIYNLGEDVVGVALAQELSHGTLHNAMLDDLTNRNIEKDVVTAELITLQHAYDLNSLTELFGVQGDDFSNAVRELTRTENTIKWIRYKENKYNGELPYDESQEASRQWLAKAISAGSGMPVEEALKYSFSVSRKDDEASFLKVIKTFDHFGVDRIRSITEASGITGLEAYSIEQLERMEKFANHPHEISQNLKDHDVLAIMVNRSGDHNGVMGNIAETYDDNTGRVLFFEIDSLEDIYRDMIKLKKADIQPSTLVLAAHSSPGQFIVTNQHTYQSERHNVAAIGSRRLVESVNATKEAAEKGIKGFSMHGMHGMARVVDELMAPSKAIDDNKTLKDHKKIIFQACDAASETELKDLDESGEKIQIGMESVISQLAKDLIESGIKSNVDVFGAPAGIQVHRTEKGVRYSGQPDGSNKRTKLHAEQIQIKNGELSKHQVDEILIRN